MKLRNAPRPATAFGVDIGKNLFPRCGARPRWDADPEGDVSARHALAVLRTRGTYPGRDGGLPRLAMVGTQDCSDGAHRPHYSSSIREAFREV